MAYNLQMFFLFFSADRCVGPAATVAGLTLFFLSSVEVENRDPGQPVLARSVEIFIFTMSQN